MPLGCIVCTALIVSQPLVYPYTNGNFGHIKGVSISYTAWGFSCCSFHKTVAMRRPLDHETSNSAGLHAFFLSLHYLS